jgi:hypothetical protein
VSAGVNVLALERMLGHTSAKVTLDTHADLFDDDLDAVAVTLHAPYSTQSVGAGWAARPAANMKRPLTCVDRIGAMAVAEGFEPSDGGYPSHAFEACSLGRSDTPPCGTLQPDDRAKPIADQALI